MRLKENIKISKDIALFLGMLVTDGGVRRDGTMIFHSASEKWISNLFHLIFDVWGINKKHKCF